jgi:ATP-dependent Clp protease ATP-binding subunit ClpC
MKKNITALFSNHTKKAINKAKKIALKQRSKELTNIHLLYGIAFQKGSVGHNILKDIGFEKNTILNYEDGSLKNNEQVELPFSRDLKETIRQATKIAAKNHYPYIGTEHLVYALFRSKDKILKNLIKKTIKNSLEQQKEKDLLLKEEKNKEKIKKEKSFLGSPTNNSHIFNITGFDHMNMPDFFNTFNSNFDKSLRQKDEFNPLIRFAKNLNKLGSNKRSHPIIGREKEISRIIDITLRKNKNNPILIGEPGVGKTAIAAALAKRINKGEVPNHMANKTIYELDLGLLLSGTTFRGEFEQRMKDLIDYLTQRDDIIIFIDEIHNLMGAGNSIGSMDAANMLKPALAKGDIKVIGATTYDEYKKYIEKDAALERRFQPIKVLESSLKDTKKILMGIKENFEKFHKVIIDKKAINAAIKLSKRYINDRFLPDKAIDLIDEAQSRVKANAVSFELNKKIKRCNFQKRKIKNLKEKLVYNDKFNIASDLKRDEQELESILKIISTEQKRREKLAYLRITENDVREVVSTYTGIPVDELNQSFYKDLNLIKNKFSQKIIGQKHVIDALVKTIGRSVSGINDPNRPLGSFIFIGPTGVGKTYTAKILAKMLFKDENAFIRIDMSEFSQRHTVSQLLGAPAGYVGYEEGGKLTEKVRRNPYSLILFDEIEKAHPTVFNILLQILEDGILTDGQGRAVNFKNTIIVMTSNIGSSYFINQNIGFLGQNENSLQKEKKINILEELREMMIPELLNRIDKISIFNILSQKDLKEIAKQEVQKLNKRLKKNKLKLSLDKKVYEHLAKISHDNKEGARKLRKKIEKHLQDPLIDFLLEKPSYKDYQIKAKLKNKKIVLNKIN